MKRRDQEQDVPDPKASRAQLVAQRLVEQLAASRRAEAEYEAGLDPRQRCLSTGD
jgi:hypothetical protein